MTSRQWALLLPGWDGEEVVVDRGSLKEMRRAAANYPGARVVSLHYCRAHEIPGVVV